MAISTTTFDQRIKRINSGKTLNAPEVCITAPKSGAKKTRGFTMLLLVCASMMGAGGAMAWADLSVEYDWILALAQ